MRRNVNPDASELCNTELLDEDCDGAVDEGCGCPSAGLAPECAAPSPCPLLTSYAAA